MEKKSPSLPATPTYQEDPRYQQGINQLFGLGGRLTEFQGLPSELMETITTSPQTTTMFLEGLKSQLDPIFRDIRRDTVNQLAANNQLESSTTASKLGEIESDLQKNYISQSTTFGLADIDRALRNRLSLFSSGLNTLNTATGMAGQSESQKNQFNLQNYDNLVANALNEKDTKGGWGGALQGAIGGGLAGFSVGGPWGAVAGAGAGGLGGYYGESGVGTGLLQGGATMYGSKYKPGSSAGALEDGLSLTNTEDDIWNYPWMKN